TLTALAAFRQFGVAYLPALAGSLLYAYLPYHLFRNEGHLFLAAYYLVPLAVMVALWVYLDESQKGVGSRKIQGRGLGFFDSRPLFETRGRLCAAVIICLLVSSAGVYYAVFTGFFF